MRRIGISAMMAAQIRVRMLALWWTGGGSRENVLLATTEGPFEARSRVRDSLVSNHKRFEPEQLTTWERAGAYLC